MGLHPTASARLSQVFPLTCLASLMIAVIPFSAWNYEQNKINRNKKNLCDLVKLLKLKKAKCN